jgi:RNA polymerase sigma factor (sigma-70 family)
VVQEVLADAIRQIESGAFKESAALGTWIHTIMNGKVADYWRKRGDATLVPLAAIAESHQSLVAGENRVEVIAVRQALSRLPALDQLLLLLHEQEGYTLEEIGPMVHLRKSAVAERLARARERYRQALNHGGNQPQTRRLTGRD